MARDAEKCLGVGPVSTRIRLAVAAAAGFIWPEGDPLRATGIGIVSFTNSSAQRPAPPPQSGLYLAGWHEGFFPRQVWDCHSVAMSC